LHSDAGGCFPIHFWSGQAPRRLLLNGPEREAWGGFDTAFTPTSCLTAFTPTSCLAAGARYFTASFFADAACFYPDTSTARLFTGAARLFFTTIVGQRHPATAA
jgi:hypothetical protein